MQLAQREPERYTSGMSKAPYSAKPQEVGVRELRDHLSEWLAEVKDGREIVITERGKPIARLVRVGEMSRYEELIRTGVITPATQPKQPASSFGRVRSKGDVSSYVSEQRR